MSIYSKLITLLSFITGLSGTMMAQQSQLYLYDLALIDGQFELSHPRYLSGFNEDGYTDQPFFIDPYRILVSAGKKEKPSETDLYELHLREKSVKRITMTPDREYSPSIHPDAPEEIKCVIVDTKNENKQLLWRYPTDLSDGGRTWLSKANNVGYYCELDSGWVAVFEVGTPNQLYLIHAETGEKRFVSAKIGRTLRRSSDGSLIYVHKFSETHWFLKQIRPDQHVPSIIKKTIPNAEDFEVIRDDGIMMGSGSKLYFLDIKGDMRWREIADLNLAGINNITRLRYNGINMLAVVNGS